jgi:diketogulonate reductase-like aldo/keto reductase
MAHTEIPTITLNNGVKIPQLGLGTWQSQDGNEVESAVADALKAGYRLIDTAAVYGNEKGIGRAIKKSGVKREELFITSKLWNSDQGVGTAKAFAKSLARLELEYLDLFLIHWPAPAAGKFVETWKILEELYAQKRIRAIGVSNFKIHHLEELLEDAAVVPAVNQIELHPHFQQQETADFCKKHGIQVEAYSPLGGAGGSVLDELAVQDIAFKHHKTPAQVVICWHLQKGYVVIPKATRTPHITANIDVLGFRLDFDDMKQIAGLETGKKRLPDPDNFNSGIKTGLVQLGHKFNLVKARKEK